eukprot:UN0850
MTRAKARASVVNAVFAVTPFALRAGSGSALGTSNHTTSTSATLAPEFSATDAITGAKAEAKASMSRDATTAI